MYIIYLVSLLFVFNGVIELEINERTKILIDTDMGTSNIEALIYLLLKEDIDIVGITLVANHYSMKDTEYIAANIISIAERSDIPVYSGTEKNCQGKTITNDYSMDKAIYSFKRKNLVNYIDPSIQAHQAISILSERYKGKLIIIALGPHTNLALAVKYYPVFIHQIKKLYTLNGEMYSREVGPNFFTELFDQTANLILTSHIPPGRSADFLRLECFLSGKFDKEISNNIFGRFSVPSRTRLITMLYTILSRVQGDGNPGFIKRVNNNKLVMPPLVLSILATNPEFYEISLEVDVSQNLFDQCSVLKLPELKSIQYIKIKKSVNIEEHFEQMFKP